MRADGLDRGPEDTASNTDSNRHCQRQTEQHEACRSRDRTTDADCRRTLQGAVSRHASNRGHAVSVATPSRTYGLAQGIAPPANEVTDERELGEEQVKVTSETWPTTHGRFG